MNTWANELLMSSRRFNPSVLPLKEADRQKAFTRHVRGWRASKGHSSQLIFSLLAHTQTSLMVNITKLH